MMKVGQKVVCIDDSAITNANECFVHIWPVKGQVYTIREIHTEPHIKGYGVRLEEIWNSSIVWSDGDECEWSYQSERFRPIVEADKSEVAANEMVMG
jgi:hypothetical protein